MVSYDLGEKLVTGLYGRCSLPLMQEGILAPSLPFVNEHAECAHGIDIQGRCLTRLLVPSNEPAVQDTGCKMTSHRLESPIVPDPWL